MSEIQRVYFREAVYVGTESHNSVPAVADSDDVERRKRWGFAEDAIGITVTYVHQNGRVYTSRAPWANVKGVVYFDKPALQKVEGGRK